MRLPQPAALVLATASVWAAEAVCMNPGGNPVVTYRAEAIAAKILQTADVQVVLRDDKGRK
jgi:hypothetical protein